MKKEEIITELDGSRADLLDAIDGLSPQQLLAPNAVGEWSVRDVLQHVSLWEAELIKLMLHIDQDRRPTVEGLGPNADFKAINARWHAETRERPLERVLEDLHGVRRQTRRWVAGFSEDDLTRVRTPTWLRQRPLWRWIADYSFEHEREHTDQIRAWRTGRKAEETSS